MRNKQTSQMHTEKQFPLAAGLLRIANAIQNEKKKPKKIDRVEGWHSGAKPHFSEQQILHMRWLSMWRGYTNRQISRLYSLSYGQTYRYLGYITRSRIVPHEHDFTSEDAINW